MVNIKDEKEKGGKKEKKTENVEKKIEKKSEKNEEKHTKKPFQEPTDKVKKKIRFLEYVLDGDKKIKDALREVKGLGHRLAAVIAKTQKFGDKTMGELSEEEITGLENYVKNLHNHVPAWMLNHRNDQFTGQNLHYIGTDLTVAVKQDIDFMKKIRCYKGVRHIMGQPVRGQRTRTSFRSGKTVGVIKKKSAPAKAKSSEEKKEKK